MSAGIFPYIDRFRTIRNHFHDLRTYQSVEYDHVCLFDQCLSLECQQTTISGACADKVNFTVHLFFPFHLHCQCISEVDALLICDGRIFHDHDKRLAVFVDIKSG